MLISKHKLIINGCDVPQDFSRYAQDSRVDVAVVVPKQGVPLTAQSKLLTPVFLNSPVEGSGTAMKRTTALNFKCNLFNEGVVVERLGDRRRMLEFLVAKAKNKSNRVRAERELARFNSLSAGQSDKTILWIAAVDSRGDLYVSSSGVLQSADVVASEVAFSNGKHLGNIWAGNVEVEQPNLAQLNLRRVQPMAVNQAITEQEVREALSLTGCLLTIRGFHAAGRSADDVIAEWNLVAQPLLEALPNQVFTSWELPWAISTFRSLRLSSADQARANFVAPYLTCALGIIASSSSSAELDNVRLITALEVGQWNKANDQYTVRINDKVLVVDSMYTSMIDNALAMSKDAVRAVATEVLQAAEIYGRAIGDGTLWTTVLWLEWLGVQGLMGGLALNASE